MYPQKTSIELVSREGTALTDADRENEQTVIPITVLKCAQRFEFAGIVWREEAQYAIQFVIAFRQDGDLENVSASRATFESRIEQRILFRAERINAKRVLAPSLPDDGELRVLEAFG